MILVFISLIIGLSPIVLSKLHASTLEKLFSLSFLLIFVPFISALFGTLSFSQVIQFNLFSGMAFFFGWFTTVYVIDRALIHLNGSKYAKFLRISIGILFGVLHGLLLDAYIFREDINLVLQKRATDEAAVIDSVRQVSSEINLSTIHALQQKISDKEEFIVKKRHEIFLEIDGQAASGLGDCGPVCKQKKVLFSQDSLQKYSEIAEIRNQITAIKLENAKIDSLKKIEIEALPNYITEAGLKTRLDVAHDILISHGSFSTRIIAIVLFLLSIIFEQLILIFKDYLGIKEYKDQEQRLVGNTDTYNKTVDSNDLTIALQKEVNRLIKVIDEINIKTSEEIMRTKMENVKTKSKIASDELDFYDQQMSDTFKSDSYFKGEREDVIKDAVNEMVKI